MIVSEGNLRLIRSPIGIATGHASRIWVLDVDIADGKRGDETLAALEATHGPLPDTHEVVTGSGGRHLYFAWPDGIDIRNDQSGRLGPGLDIRGEALDPAVALRPGIAMVVVTVQEQPRFEGAHCPRDDAAIAGACGCAFQPIFFSLAPNDRPG